MISMFMDEKVIRTTIAALDQGHRVHLKKLKDGTFKIQIVFQKELKVN